MLKFTNWKYEKLFKKILNGGSLNEEQKETKAIAFLIWCKCG